MSKIIEKSIKMQQHVYSCFNYYKKSFGKNNHKEVIHTLHDVGLNWKDLHLTHNIYCGQKARAYINQNEKKKQNCENKWNGVR